MVGLAAQVTGVLGPSAGGLLVGAFGWRLVFLVNVPLALIGVALASWAIPRQS